MRKYLDMIIAKGNQEDMECLGNMLKELIYESPKKDKYIMKLKGMAYDYKLDNELAKEIVEDMKPLGQYWTKEQVASVTGDVSCNMYVVMNSLANDYNSVIPLEDVNTYVKLARAWLDDEDARDDKVWWYFVRA